MAHKNPISASKPARLAAVVAFGTIRVARRIYVFFLVWFRVTDG